MEGSKEHESSSSTPKANLISTPAPASTSTSVPLMSDPQRRLGTITTQNRTDRLMSIRSGPNLTLGGVPKREFAPLIPSACRKRDGKLDNVLPGPIPELLKDSTSQLQPSKFRPPAKAVQRQSFKPKSVKWDTKKPPSLVPTSSRTFASSSPFAMGPPVSDGTKKRFSTPSFKSTEELGTTTTKEMEIDTLNPNHPTVLPFVDPRRPWREFIDDPDKKNQKPLIGKIKTEYGEYVALDEAIPSVPLPHDLRVTSTTTKQVQSKMEEIPEPLRERGEWLNEDNLFFIQLPSSLPFIPSTDPPTPIFPPPSFQPTQTPSQSPSQPTLDQSQSLGAGAATGTGSTGDSGLGNTSAGIASGLGTGLNTQTHEFTSTLHSVQGHLGKILVFKSGKIKLKIGDMLYDIAAANNPNFLEELVVLDNKCCLRVGPMTQHLIVTPDIDDLLDKTL